MIVAEILLAGMAAFRASKELLYYDFFDLAMTAIFFMHIAIRRASKKSRAALLLLLSINCH